jgi:hypothetical protein
VLVWGGIALLLVLVAVQARARLGYTMTLNALQDRIAEDEGPNPRPLLVSEVDTHLVGWPSRSESKEGEHRSSIRLSWRGLTSSYEITLPFDPSETEPAVMGLETKDAPPIEEEFADTSTAPAPTGPPGGMPGGMPGGPPGMHGAGGPPGSGGGRDPMANDADGDGKLSREEAQGRLQENFDGADADGDGFLVLEEITAWREANPRPPSDGEQPAATGEGAAPEGSTPAETPSESAPAEGAAPEAGSPEAGDNPAESGSPGDTESTPPADTDPSGSTPAESGSENSESENRGESAPENNVDE